MTKVQLHHVAATLSIAFALTAMAMLAGCAGESPSSETSVEGLTGGVAATVDGVEIQEDEITTYIESFRSSSQMTDEESWGTYLASSGLDAPGIREQVINYYISRELVGKECEKEGITVTDEELEEQIGTMRSNYDSEEAWQAALSQAGTTEELYRENVKQSMLESKLNEKLAETVEPVTDEELLSYVQMYIDMFDGAKRSSHILFSVEDANDEEAKKAAHDEAEKLLERLKNGEIKFEAAAKEYSQDTRSAEKNGDVGWDMLATMQGGGFVQEYTDALAELDKDEMSGLVESQFGYHIIKCTDIYSVPEGGITSIDQAPEDLVEYIRTMMDDSKKQSALSEWVSTAQEEADIKINDMPEGVPYNVDVTKYQTEDVESSASSDLSVEVEEVTDSSDAASTGEESSGAEDEGSSSASEDAAAESSQPAEVSSEAQTSASEDAAASSAA